MILTRDNPRMEKITIIICKSPKVEKLSKSLRAILSKYYYSVVFVPYVGSLRHLSPLFNTGFGFQISLCNDSCYWSCSWSSRRGWSSTLLDYSGHFLSVSLRCGSVSCVLSSLRSCISQIFCLFSRLCLPCCFGISLCFVGFLFLYAKSLFLHLFSFSSGFSLFLFNLCLLLFRFAISFSFLSLCLSLLLFKLGLLLCQICFIFSLFLFGF